MKKYLTLALVLAVVTAVNVGFRNSFHLPAEASLSSAARTPRGEPAVTPDLRECAADSQAPGGAGGDVLFARLAADCGNHLLDQARRKPGDRHLLRQAAQHLRACLSHEPTARNAGALFTTARRNLEEAERLLARLDAGRAASPAARPAPPAAPAEAETSAAAEAKPARPGPAGTTEPVMVGPDGVIYKRVKQP